MPLTYIPMILDERLLPDGEAAQILSFLDSGSPGNAIVAVGGAAKAYRKGHMRLSFLLLWSDLANGAQQQATISLRSPFPDDDGDQTNRPLVQVTSAATTLIGANGVIVLPTGGAPNTPTNPATDWLATFNGKAIPNWRATFALFGSPTGEGAAWVHILWGHTVGN